MREIKFRTYDKKIKKFHYWDSISQKYDNVFWVMAKDEEMPIGQFTGLHDRNGAEIYEGDVLFEPDTQDKYKVYYDSSMTEYRIENIIDECDDRQLNSIHEPEIIGNIYENNNF